MIRLRIQTYTGALVHFFYNCSRTGSRTYSRWTNSSHPQFTFDTRSCSNVNPLKCIQWGCLHMVRRVFYSLGSLSEPIWVWKWFAYVHLFSSIFCSISRRIWPSFGSSRARIALIDISWSYNTLNIVWTVNSKLALHAISTWTRCNRIVAIFLHSYLSLLYISSDLLHWIWGSRLVWGWCRLFAFMVVSPRIKSFWLRTHFGWSKLCMQWIDRASIFCTTFNSSKLLCAWFSYMKVPPCTICCGLASCRFSFKWFNNQCGSWTLVYLISASEVAVRTWNR